MASLAPAKPDTSAEKDYYKLSEIKSRIGIPEMDEIKGLVKKALGLYEYRELDIELAGPEQVYVLLYGGGETLHFFKSKEARKFKQVGLVDQDDVEHIIQATKGRFSSLEPGSCARHEFIVPAQRRGDLHLTGVFVKIEPDDLYHYCFGSEGEATQFIENEGYQEVPI